MGARWASIGGSLWREIRASLTAALSSPILRQHIYKLNRLVVVVGQATAAQAGSATDRHGETVLRPEPAPNSAAAAAAATGGHRYSLSTSAAAVAYIENDTEFDHRRTSQQMRAPRKEVAAEVTFDTPFYCTPTVETIVTLIDESRHPDPNADDAGAMPPAPAPASVIAVESVDRCGFVLVARGAVAAVSVAWTAAAPAIAGAQRDERVQWCQQWVAQCRGTIDPESAVLVSRKAGDKKRKKDGLQLLDVRKLLALPNKQTPDA